MKEEKIIFNVKYAVTSYITLTGCVSSVVSPCGVVVNTSDKKTEDVGFESRQGLKNYFVFFQTNV